MTLGCSRGRPAYIDMDPLHCMPRMSLYSTYGTRHRSSYTSRGKGGTHVVNQYYRTLAPSTGEGYSVTPCAPIIVTVTVVHAISDKKRQEYVILRACVYGGFCMSSLTWYSVDHGTARRIASAFSCRRGRLPTLGCTA